MNICTGILGGMCISLGCCGYAASNNMLFGAVIFAMGLLIIKSSHLSLYTGAIGRFTSLYSLYKCIIILALNIIGVIIIYLIAIQSPDLTNNLTIIANNKASLPLRQLFFMAIPCGFIMYFATCSSSNTILTIMCVTLFIIAGFEHSIADSFYLLFANLNAKTYLIQIGLIAIGNGIGANISSRLLKLERANKNDK